MMEKDHFKRSPMPAKRHIHEFSPVFVQMDIYRFILRCCRTKNHTKFLANYDGIVMYKPKSIPKFPFEELPPELAEELKKLIEQRTAVN